MKIWTSSRSIKNSFQNKYTLCNFRFFFNPPSGVLSIILLCKHIYLFNTKIAYQNSHLSLAQNYVIKLKIRHYKILRAIFNTNLKSL